MRVIIDKVQSTATSTTTSTITSTRDITSITTTTTSLISTSITTTTTALISTSTSTSNTSSKPTTTSTSVSHAGVSSGAVAGIGISCAILGLAIGIVLAILFAPNQGKTKKQKHRTETTNISQSRPRNANTLPRGPSSTTSTRSRNPIASGTSDPNRLNQFLLASNSDSEIIDELQALGNLIMQHVERYYSVLPDQGSHSTLSSNLSAQGLENESSVSSSLLVEITFDPDPERRAIALNHIITCVIFGSFVFPRDPRLFSLLPESVSMFMQELPKVEAQIGNRQAYELALTKWRQLTAFLLNSNRSGRTPLTPHDRKLAPRAEELVHRLEPFLNVFVTPELRNSQQRHLEKIVQECAKFGYLLFSQPGELRLTFTSGKAPAGSTELVTCPGLERVSGDKGNRYSAAQLILSAQTQQYY